MKKIICRAVFSGAFAVSAATAVSANPVIVIPEPLEVVATSRYIMVGKNIHNIEVLNNVPEKSVTLVDLHAVGVRMVMSCKEVFDLKARMRRMSPEERLDMGLWLSDSPESRESHPFKLTISDIYGPVDRLEAEKQARVMVAGFAYARLDHAMEQAVKFCSPP